MGTYNVGELKKGLKVQIDGEPYRIAECNFRKPGKGQAIYELRLKSLTRGTMLDRSLRSGDTIETADVTDFEVQFLYRQGDSFHFMNNTTFEQYEMSLEQVDEAWKYLKDGMACSMTLFNGLPIGMEPPNHVVLKIEYTEPAARGNTATNINKPAQVETGAEIMVPPFIDIGDVIRVDTRTGEYLERVKE